MTNTTGTAAQPLVAGNWKMNGLKASTSELVALLRALADKPAAGCEVLICPPFTLLMAFDSLLSDTPVGLGAQDCHHRPSGPHTGDISAEMLTDAGCSYVIVGHSERRTDHGEDDDTVWAKAAAGHRAGLTAIVCVGESDVERNAGHTLKVVGGQIARSIPDGATAANTVVAYEPVWAIGSGRTPSPENVADVHAMIRERLVERFGQQEGGAMRILYGGSVKADNARELMAVDNVDGALVGGASLRAADFDGIIDAYRQAA